MKKKRATTHTRAHAKRAGSHYNVLLLKDGRDVMELARGVLDVNGAFYPLPYEWPDDRPVVKALDLDDGRLMYFPAAFVKDYGPVTTYR